MSLEKIFDVVDKLRSTASADAAFGEPQQVEGRVLIPVACVATGLGVGFGQETPELGQEAQAPRDAEAPGGGGGGGGGARSRPVAVIEVTDSETIVRPIVDETIVALAGIALAGWTVFCLLVTIRAVFGKKPQGN